MTAEDNRINIQGTKDSTLKHKEYCVQGPRSARARTRTGIPAVITCIRENPRRTRTTIQRTQIHHEGRRITGSISRDPRTRRSMTITKFSRTKDYRIDKSLSLHVQGQGLARSEKSTEDTHNDPEDTDPCQSHSETERHQQVRAVSGALY